MVSFGVNLHEMSNPTFSEEYNQFVLCWISLETDKELHLEKRNLVHVRAYISLDFRAVSFPFIDSYASVG